MIVRRCDDVMERQRRREKETAQSKTEFERVKEKKRLILHEVKWQKFRRVCRVSLLSPHIYAKKKKKKKKIFPMVQG